MISDVDPSSRTWGAVEGWARAELERARSDNDVLTRTDIQTAALRGRIKILKELLELHLPGKRRQESKI